MIVKEFEVCKLRKFARDSKFTNARQAVKEDEFHCYSTSEYFNAIGFALPKIITKTLSMALAWLIPVIRAVNDANGPDLILTSSPSRKIRFGGLRSDMSYFFPVSLKSVRSVV